MKTPDPQSYPAYGAPDRAAAIRLGLLSAILGVLYYLYQFFGVTDVGYDIHDTTRSAFRWIYERWLGDWRGTKFAHSHWVPLVSLMLVWLDRRALTRLPRSINFWGLGVILLGLALHWAGIKSQQTRLTILSMVVLSWGIPLFAAGWPVARRLIFPCGFLVFSLPLNFFDAAAYPLRTFSAAFSSGLLNGLGIAVTRAGSVLVAAGPPEYSINLGDSRSSIFAVTAVIAFALVCAYLIRCRWPYRALLVVAALPVFVFAQVIRGTLGVFFAEILGAKSGGAFFRSASGPLVCLITFGGLAGLAWYIHRKSAWAQPVMETNHRNDGKYRPTKALAITLLILVAAAWWIPTNLNIQHSEESGIRLDLPVVLGAWQGETLLYCHNPAESREVVDGSLRAGDPCPSCGWALEEMAIAEKMLLPPDTMVKKMQYVDPIDRRRVFFSIVLSGKDRASIHRPEVCLVGPDSEIAHSFVHRVPLSDGRDLPVRILEMVIRVRDPEGKIHQFASYYAYWFAGMNRETHSHLQRMIWMAWDRLFRNQSSRWAYLSLAGGRIPGQTDYLTEIDAFIREAYPALARPPASGQLDLSAE